MFIYLFIYFWLCWVFISVRGLSPVAASGGHSSSRCAGLSLSRPLLLRSTGSRRAGSVIVAHGPSCSAACGILPDQGPNPCPPHRQADSQPLHHQGSPIQFLNLGLTEVFSWLDSGYAAPTGICRSDKVSFSGYHLPRHVMCICPLLRRLIWIIRSSCFWFLHSLVYHFSPCYYSTVCDETLGEHADGLLLIQPFPQILYPVMCLAWINLYYHGYKRYFFTPSLLPHLSVCTLI